MGRETEPPVAKMTLQTIADRLGVSRMTVSNAFSRPDQLSDELRRRVLATAEELGYAGPDPAARALARGTTGAVGVLLTDSLPYAFTDEVATSFLAAVVDELAPTGLALTLLTTTERTDAVPARDLGMDGAIVYSCRTESPARDWLMRRKLPLVFVDQDTEPGIDSINIDDRDGARAAAQHLIDLGHRRIAVVTLTIDGVPGIVEAPVAASHGYPQRERMLGWLEPLERGEVHPTVVQVRSNADEDAHEAARLLLTGPEPPTAVLCFSDVLALGIIQAAANLAVTVPDQLSVIGFDDSPVARRARPLLTTVRQDVASKGQAAASALVAAIAHAGTGKRRRARRMVLPTELVVRASTAAAPDTRRAR
jgi:DNA-binding LacI/PurR family transcriptional regulator